MSNNTFIQVDPPKEELTLPANIVDFEIIPITKSSTTASIQFKSTVATFTGVLVGDFIELSIVDKNTLVETKLFSLEVSAVTSASDIESASVDVTLDRYKEIFDSDTDWTYFRRSDIIPKIYKLPTNNFNLQIKSDSIVRYYEDPVDKTIMYIDVLESPSICGNGGPGVCVDIWGHDRASLGIVTLNNTDKIPMHNIVPYLNSIFLGSDDEN